LTLSISGCTCHNANHSLFVILCNLLCRQFYMLLSKPFCLESYWFYIHALLVTYCVACIINWLCPFYHLNAYIIVTLAISIYESVIKPIMNNKVICNAMAVWLVLLRNYFEWCWFWGCFGIFTPMDNNTLFIVMS
jgi:hypothetical protein